MKPLTPEDKAQLGEKLLLPRHCVSELGNELWMEVLDKGVLLFTTEDSRHRIVLDTGMAITAAMRLVSRTATAGRVVMIITDIHMADTSDHKQLFKLLAAANAKFNTLHMAEGMNPIYTDIAKAYTRDKTHTALTG